MRALVVADIGFGDAGKGSIVDYLTREHHAGLVVFFNGGAQRLHNVVTDDGRHHTFSQFGSGTFAGARTYHSRFSLVNPMNLFIEAGILESVGITNPLDLVDIDAQCRITTRFHIAANRLREIARGNSRHGSCGQGIGETAWDDERELGLFASDLRDLENDLDMRLSHIQARKRQELAADGITPISVTAPSEWKVLTEPSVVRYLSTGYRRFANTVSIRDGIDLEAHDTVIFEGSQGVLLDGDYGFDPYTTWSNCTFDNALAVLSEFDADVTRVGVTRGYGVRHGPGPFPTEERDLPIPEPHNATGQWQGPVRWGYTDLVLVRYALDVLGDIDTLAVTCLDHLRAFQNWKVCNGYHWPGAPATVTRLFHTPAVVRQHAHTYILQNCAPIYDNCDSAEVPHILSEAAGVPLGVTSWGPTARRKVSYATL